MADEKEAAGPAEPGRRLHVTVLLVASRRALDNALEELGFAEDDDRVIEHDGRLAFLTCTHEDDCDDLFALITELSARGESWELQSRIDTETGRAVYQSLARHRPVMAIVDLNMDQAPPTAHTVGEVLTRLYERHGGCIPIVYSANARDVASRFGDGFTADRLPRTAALSARVRAQEDEISAPLKSAFQRVRPYNQDGTLHPVCKTKTKADSYPSGHALAGWLDALTLVDLAPEKREAILARADAYARNRLVCGVHFASDIEASKLLAYAVHAAMQGNPAYQQDVAAARAELREALQNIPANSRAAP